MSGLDWLVLIGSTLFIMLYGIWKTRHTRDLQGYMLSGSSMKWWVVCLSIMATQASAITFLSTPGQAYGDGMRFVQFYFGVPIAMVLISVVAIPIYRNLQVYTAYQYLESRFDLKTRVLTATLFLIGRGMAAGMTIYAPAIIMSSILGWDTYLTCIVVGVAVLAYTFFGGNAAVSQTQTQQMAIILIGMLVCGVVMVLKLPPDISFADAMSIAGRMNKLNAITTPSWEKFDIKDQYNLWSGLIGGTFLALSYFGTDQSQVQRYLGGKSTTQIRLGLLFNGILKVPMQFLILLIGVLMFVFYQFAPTPVFFNKAVYESVSEGPYQEPFAAAEAAHDQLMQLKQAQYREMLAALDAGDEQAADRAEQALETLEAERLKVREQAVNIIRQHNPRADTKDQDRIFLSFVLDHLPHGLVGLLISVIIAAAMSSSAAELNSLSTTAVIDVYRRLIRTQADDKELLLASRGMTLMWGGIAIGFALIAGQFGNLIQAVNLVGSLFYGTILGIFVVAFFIRHVQGTAVFAGALLAEAVVVLCYVLPLYGDSFKWLDIGFLWYNLIGCLAVCLFSLLIQVFLRRRPA
ncbi:MAG: sodium:solute symporter [Bacteroidia bacterium]|nr:sodium:solute symporter [Bacteroidia bacterium]